MLKRTITYVDYDGNARTEDFYFNLNKAELLEMQLSVDGSFTSQIERIVEAQEMPRLFSIFKEIVLKSYGVKSPDGKRFMKSTDLREAFEQTEAYSSLILELSTDAKAAADFINGTVPADLKVTASQLKSSS